MAKMVKASTMIFPVISVIDSLMARPHWHVGVAAAKA
jgi:hypothetical protein